MNRRAHHTDADADQRQHLKPSLAVTDYQARLHALVEGFVVCGQELRVIHDRYTAVQGEGASHEQREKLHQLLHAELDVLRASQRIHEQLDELLRSSRELRSVRASSSTRA